MCGYYSRGDRALRWWRVAHLSPFLFSGAGSGTMGGRQILVSAFLTEEKF